MNISETVPMERRRAIVVGAAGGIGSDICRRMALEGYRVVVADYNEDRAREVLRTLAGEGHDVNVFDGTNDRAVDAAFESTAEDGTARLLVAGSGGAAGNPDTPHHPMCPTYTTP